MPTKRTFVLNCGLLYRNKVSDIKQRARGTTKDYWDEFCKHVAKDRQDNDEETASANRLGEIPEHNADCSDDDDEDGGVDPDYF